MGPGTRLTRLFAPLTAGALSAALAFTLVRPASTDAGPGQRPPPDAVSGDVSLEGALVREGQAWSVRIRAVNGGDIARRCQVTAAVTELLDSPMSRVIRLPRTVWETGLAVAVPARGEAAQRVSVPARVARRLAATPPPSKAPLAPSAADELGEQLPDLGRTTLTHAVRLHAVCLGAGPVG
jgi:hypothetical protein